MGNEHTSLIDIEYLRSLLEVFDASTVQELKIEQEGVEIRLSKNTRAGEPMAVQQGAPYPFVPGPFIPPSVQQQAPAVQTAPPATGDNGAAKSAEEPAISANLHEVRSPIVGTFYAAPNPDSPSFVEVGREVKPGDVLCIVEAMKLMNEIESDVAGKVVKVLVQNAQPVEYDQPLFLIEKI